MLAAALTAGCSRETTTENTAASGQTVVTITIPGMTCNNCVGTLRSAFRKVDGYETDRFDLESKVVEVRGGPALDQSAIIKAAEDAGFDVSDE